MSRWKSTACEQNPLLRLGQKASGKWANDPSERIIFLLS